MSQHKIVALNAASLSPQEVAEKQQALLRSFLPKEHLPKELYDIPKMRNISGWEEVTKEEVNLAIEQWKDLLVTRNLLPAYKRTLQLASKSAPIPFPENFSELRAYHQFLTKRLKPEELKLANLQYSLITSLDVCLPGTQAMVDKQSLKPWFQKFVIFYKELPVVDQLKFVTEFFAGREYYWEGERQQCGDELAPLALGAMQKYLSTGKPPTETDSILKDDLSLRFYSLRGSILDEAIGEHMIVAEGSFREHREFDRFVRMYRETCCREADNPFGIEPRMGIQLSLSEEFNKINVPKILKRFQEKYKAAVLETIRDLFRTAELFSWDKIPLPMDFPEIAAREMADKFRKACGDSIPDECMYEKFEFTDAKGLEYAQSFLDKVYVSKSLSLHELIEGGVLTEEKVKASAREIIEYFPDLPLTTEFKSKDGSRFYWVNALIAASTETDRHTLQASINKQWRQDPDFGKYILKESFEKLKALDICLEQDVVSMAVKELVSREKNINENLDKLNSMMGLCRDWKLSDDSTAKMLLDRLVLKGEQLSRHRYYHHDVDWNLFVKKVFTDILERFERSESIKTMLQKNVASNPVFYSKFIDALEGPLPTYGVWIIEELALTPSSDTLHKSLMGNIRKIEDTEIRKRLALPLLVTDALNPPSKKYRLAKNLEDTGLSCNEFYDFYLTLHPDKLETLLSKNNMEGMRQEDYAVLFEKFKTRGQLDERLMLTVLEYYSNERTADIEAFPYKNELLSWLTQGVGHLSETLNRAIGALGAVIIRDTDKTLGATQSMLVKVAQLLQRCEFDVFMSDDLVPNNVLQALKEHLNSYSEEDRKKLILGLDEQVYQNFVNNFAYHKDVTFIKTILDDRFSDEIRKAQCIEQLPQFNLREELKILYFIKTPVQSLGIEQISQILSIRRAYLWQQFGAHLVEALKYFARAENRQLMRILMNSPFFNRIAMSDMKILIAGYYPREDQAVNADVLVVVTVFIDKMNRSGDIIPAEMQDYFYSLLDRHWSKEEYKKLSTQIIGRPNTLQCQAVTFDLFQKMLKSNRTLITDTGIGEALISCANGSNGIRTEFYHKLFGAMIESFDAQRGLYKQNPDGLIKDIETYSALLFLVPIHKVQLEIFERIVEFASQIQKELQLCLKTNHAENVRTCLVDISRKLLKSYPKEQAYYIELKKIPKKKLTDHGKKVLGSVKKRSAIYAKLLKSMKRFVPAEDIKRWTSSPKPSKSKRTSSGIF